MLKAKLVVVGGDAKSGEVRLKLPTVIGRGKEASLTVPHALVSRRHTEIFEKEGRLFVRDLGSLNGTFVNSTKIDGETPLAPNQLLTLGNITFRAVYEVASQADEETVNFDEVKTAETIGALKKGVVADGNDFDKAETVPVPIPSASADVDDNPFDFVEAENDSFEKAVSQNAGSQDAVSDASAEASEATPKVKESTGTGRASAEVERPAEANDSIFSAGEEKSSGEDTDKSIIGSNVFEFEGDEKDPASKSVAVDALDELPTGPAQAASFVGKVDFGDDVKSASSQIGSVEIDLGGDKDEESVDDDSTLGSFLNKLPK
jgi:pSer/pThr/pTyr-binding forkhead associated (FHA) protein